MDRTRALAGGVLALALVLSLSSSSAQPDITDVARARARENAVPPELLVVCLEVARDVDPELAQRLENIRDTRSQAALMRALGNARHLVGLARLKLDDPKLYDVKVKTLKLEAKIDRLAEQYVEARNAGSAVAPDLKKDLNGLVAELVGYSMVARGMYLQRLNEHVKALREQISHDAQNFQSAVDERLQELLEEAEARTQP